MEFGDTTRPGVASANKIGDEVCDLSWRGCVYMWAQADTKRKQYKGGMTLEQSQLIRGPIICVLHEYY